MKNGKTITMRLDKRFTLILKGLIEINGHDDSLPYSTDVYIRDGVRETLLARVMNDGWGGPSHAIVENRNLWETAESIAASHIWFTLDGKPHYFTTVDVIDCLAYRGMLRDRTASWDSISEC